MAHTILIVEDDQDLRKMFRTALLFEGYEVLEAENGLSALWLLDRVLPPDLIQLDLRMPIMDGQTLMREVRGHAELRQVPVVVVTAAPGAHDDLDARCVLKKPVMPDALVRTVREGLGSGAATAR